MIGCRGNGQGVVSVQATSPDGNAFSGQMTYAGEGPIGLKLSLS